MSLTWDLGGFVLGTSAGLLWLVKLIMGQELAKFEDRLLISFDARYMGREVSNARYEDLARRITALEFDRRLRDEKTSRLDIIG